MEIFGFSAAKLITILIIAIIIFGPDKVPEMARTVGKTIRDVRRYFNEMTKEFNDATGGLREEFAGIAQDLRGELEATQADLRSQLDLTHVFKDVAASVTEPSVSPAFPLPHEAIAPPAASLPIDDEADVRPVASTSSPLTEMTPPKTVVPTNGNGNGSMRHATKANPFADLVLLTASRPDSQALPRNGHRETDGVRQISALPNPPRRAIGHSVAGSAYLRRKSASVASCRGLCRSACPDGGARVYGFTASHAPAPALVAAP